MEGQRIAQTILNELAYTISTRDLAGHMALVSKDAKVLLGDQVINHKGWELRRYNEFTNNMLKRVTYSDPVILEADKRSIAFQVQEQLKASDGKCYLVDKEVVLMQERDGQWRILLETIHRAHIR